MAASEHILLESDERKIPHPRCSRKRHAHIELASGARRPMRSEHLRDEMREHFRLRQNGVLSVEEYEASKARILAEHAPLDSPDGLTASERRAARLAPNMDGGWY